MGGPHQTAPAVMSFAALAAPDKGVGVGLCDAVLTKCPPPCAAAIARTEASPRLRCAFRAAAPRPEETLLLGSLAAIWAVKLVALWTQSPAHPLLAACARAAAGLGISALVLACHAGAASVALAGLDGTRRHARVHRHPCLVIAQQLLALGKRCTASGGHLDGDAFRLGGFLAGFSPSFRPASGVSERRRTGGGAGMRRCRFCAWRCLPDDSCPERSSGQS